MAQIRIPRLVPKTNGAGITSWHWQPSKTVRKAGWPPKALGKDEGYAIAAARKLNEAVDAWQAGGKRPDGIQRKQRAGTVSALIKRYRTEHVNGEKPDGSPRLKAKTRTVYETSLKRLDKWAGKHPIAYVTPARVRALRDATAKPVAKGGIGHHAAFQLLSIGRQMFRFAEGIDWITKGTNPFAQFELAKPPPRSQIWSHEDEAAFIAAAYELGMPSMALAARLALYTAQRESDLINFTEPQLQPLEILDPLLSELLAGKGGRVMGWCFDQGKMTTQYSIRQMRIPLEPIMHAEVEHAIRDNRARDRAADPPRLLTHVLIDDATGLPWKQRAFIAAVAKIRDHAAERTNRPHMKELHWHDWRRTRVVRLRRKGMSKEMIAAMTGHDPKSIDEMLKIYGPIDPTITAQAFAASLEKRA